MAKKSALEMSIMKRAIILKKKQKKNITNLLTTVGIICTFFHALTMLRKAFRFSKLH